ncbi:MAG: HEAT repeat domain-containing protein, partial [Dehalococcoidia bacterium]
RFEAATACGAIGDEEAVLHLARLLDDEDNEIQAAAISALGQTGGNDAKAVLLEWLDQSDGPLRELIEEALAEAEFANDPTAFRYRP